MRERLGNLARRENCQRRDGRGDDYGELVGVTCPDCIETEAISGSIKTLQVPLGLSQTSEYGRAITVDSPA
ncbi:hypothetical protein ACFYVL_16940 [Streptomyces sp. NPDC004111]|uniref:hypothetical protein n=1 Tax=Streptomyces sp. NPDC004111 TaxID=3364690 RepID=UPI0036AD3332